MTQSPARAGVPPDALELRVIVMHSSGAEVTSEEWADEVDDLPQAAGWMLAMLLGLPLAKQARPSEPPG